MKPPEPNCIHFDYKDREDVKHVPRFLSTRLTDSEFNKLIISTFKFCFS